MSLSIRDENSLILEQQEDFAGRLEGDEYFTDIKVLVEDRENIPEVLRTKLAGLDPKNGKVGVAVIVESPVCDDVYDNVPMGPLISQWNFMVLENRAINELGVGTKKRAFMVARRVHRIMKLYRAEGLIECLVALTPCIVPVEVPGMIGYRVQFSAQESDETIFQKCATPVFTPSEGNAGDEVAIACATPHTTIWYTTDQTHPRPGNGTQYAGAFQAPLTGAVIRAVAYRPGWVASDLRKGNFFAGVLANEADRPLEEGGNTFIP